MIKIAVFASGSGTNAENVASYFAAGEKARVTLILSNRPDAPVLERARRLGIGTEIFDRDTFYNSDRVVERLRREGIGYIVLAGFLWLVPDNLLGAYGGRILNVHPSLLPRHGGKGMYGDRVHRAVVESGDRETGITIHRVNEHYDSGDIVARYRTEVEPGDTPERVAEKVHALEYRYYPLVIEAEIDKLNVCDMKRKPSMRLLLISNSTNAGEAYLEYPKRQIADFLGGVRQVAFVPYAAVTFSYDDYLTKVQARFSELGIDVRSVHRESDPVRMLSQAEAIVVGGGNTFALVKAMQEQGLLRVIRERVPEGVPYVGWSAGSNVACPTICTTNDMPIVAGYVHGGRARSVPDQSALYRRPSRRSCRRDARTAAARVCRSQSVHDGRRASRRMYPACRERADRADRRTSDADLPQGAGTLRGTARRRSEFLTGLAVQSREAGLRGEQAAAEWLIANGFELLHRNWRSGRYELDIVALREGVLHVVEVKCRRSGALSPPEEAMTPRKFAALMRAAEHYVALYGFDTDTQFDLVTVEYRPDGECDLHYFPNAMTPRW